MLPQRLITIARGGHRLLRQLAIAAACSLAVLVSTPGGARAESESAEGPNVLLICIDDLRNQLGYLGVETANTPALDRFAATAVSFSRHYVQVPTCGASRAALMRGRYPASAGDVRNDAILKTGSDWAAESLPGWFRRQGYRTYSLGKVTHYPGNLAGPNWDAPPEELPGVWDRATIPAGPWPHAEAIMHGFANGQPRRRGVSPAIEAVEGPDSLYPDAWVADAGIELLRSLAESERPWFCAIGFFKPHLPFAAPQAWFDIHNADDFPPPPNADKPDWPSGWHRSGEFRNNYGHGGRDPDSDQAYARQLRHAYAAAVSYMDHQLGRLLETLDRIDPQRQTRVVIWGDHGFLLGEHAIWGKHCLYEEALRSPLLIRTPELPKAARGQLADAVVETVDIYPTLVDLCGLHSPTQLSGQSLRRFLDDPGAASVKPARAYWRGDAGTIREDRWRLIHTPGGRGDAPALELFDYRHDPHEMRNVAAEHPRVVARLLAQLDD